MITQKIKNFLREIFISLHIDLSKNLKYDRLTRKILKNNLTSNSNCIDIGCHKGEILDLIFQYAPKGNHYGFEPIPYLYYDLKRKYKDKATIFPYALAEKRGKSTFQLVKNAPAYSGIKKRKYAITNPDIDEIDIELQTLDEVIPSNEKIDLIKIDVEGGEFGVLKGAKSLLIKYKPIVVFECGLGASEFYGTTPKDIYEFITDTIGLNIYTLESFIKNRKTLDASTFENLFNKNKEYYYIASL